MCLDWTHLDNPGPISLFILFIWLCRVLVAVLGIFIASFSILHWGAGTLLRHKVSVFAVCRLSCSQACRISVSGLGIESESSALQGGFLITGPTGKSHNLPILESVTLIASAEFLQPCNITDPHIPGIRAWTVVDSSYLPWLLNFLLHTLVPFQPVYSTADRPARMSHVTESKSTFSHAPPALHSLHPHYLPDLSSSHPAGSPLQTTILGPPTTQVLFPIIAAWLTLPFLNVSAETQT